MLRELPHASIVLLRDGLLVAPPPTASLLSILHHQALDAAGLYDDGMPFLSITQLAPVYDELLSTLSTPCQEQVQAFQKALLSAKRTSCKAPDLCMPRPTRTIRTHEATLTTLESFCQRVGKRKRTD